MYNKGRAVAGNRAMPR